MKILNIVIKITYNLLFVLLLVSATFILLTTYDVFPGYNFYVVMSGSMEPSIHTGSIVGVKEDSNYDMEDVITVMQPNNPSETYTHRIVEKRDENDTITYKTKGDANKAADPDPVSEEQILGKVFASIPLIGYLVHFAKQPTGFILMIIVPSVIVAASELNIIKDESKKIIKARKEKKEEKQKDIKEKKEEKPKAEKKVKPKKKVKSKKKKK